MTRAPRISRIAAIIAIAAIAATVILNLALATPLTAQATDADTFLKRGQLHLQNGNLAKAINDLTYAVNLSANEPANESRAIAHNLRGKAYAQNNQLLRALQDFSLAIQLNNNYADAYINRSRIYSALHAYGRSYLDLKRARLLLGAY
ncbi:MAG: hypothetical protein OD811_06255 [Alphaproteobacteria bacterium]